MSDSKTQNTVRLGWVVVLVVVFWQACSPTPQIDTTLVNDKLGHFFVFLILGIWAQLGWKNSKHRIFLIGLLVLYGIAIESVQYFVPGRYFSLLDWLMDILGLIIAVLLIKLHARTRSSYA